MRSSVSPLSLFLVWLRVGAFAFGGGNVALESIRREFVDRRAWTTEDAFARNWALCQASPGINLLGMTVLMGRELGGMRGAVLSLLGMARPSAAVTVALAAGFGAAKDDPAVRAAMRGVVPATAGLGLASVVRAGLPLLRAGWARNRPVRMATALLPALGLIGLFACGLSPIALLLGGALTGAAFWWGFR